MAFKPFMTDHSFPLPGNRPLSEPLPLAFRREVSRRQSSSSCLQANSLPNTCPKPVPPLLIRKSDSGEQPDPDDSRSVLSSMWREIQGSNNWEQLLDPLNPILRKEIIKYGELAMACYLAFDLDPSSKRYCSCKYGKKSLLTEVGLDDSGYEITKYIYASSDTGNTPPPSRWIGFIAVSSRKETSRLGRRDILISFRGTVTHSEWVGNFMTELTPARFDPHEPRPDIKVQLGFLSLYTSTDDSCKFGHASCREQLLVELSRVIRRYKGEELSLTMGGHSLGSSLAMLLAYDIAELGLNRRPGSGEAVDEIPITVYSFAGPRVGNSAFKKRCEEVGVKVLRVVNVNDPVTKVPGLLLNEGFRVSKMGRDHPWRHECYVHVGVELALNFFKMRNPTCVHDLDCYLGLLRTWPRKVERKGWGFFCRAIQFLTKQIPLRNLIRPRSMRETS